ncbi:MAG: metallophosphatase family protein [Chloroflexi bacterium]|nr:metallophosphatase family protein [Chloroflexota bacterium]
MKVAILADIHANWVALERVVANVAAWQPDRVVVAGDVINRGPRPRECLDFVQEKQHSAGWQVVRGNHEDYILEHAGSGGCPPPEIFQTSYWTYRQLNGETAGLVAMPFQVALPGPDGREVRVVHASMRHNRDGIYPHTPDDELRQQIAPPPAVLCVGHTHVPLVRQIDGTLVVNAGSVGFPFDGDHRAGYARLAWQNGRWQADIVRLEYDVDQARRDFFESGYMAGSGALASLVLLEFDQARPNLHLWARAYEAPVLAGEIDIVESVNQFLAQFNKEGEKE